MMLFVAACGGDSRKGERVVAIPPATQPLAATDEPIPPSPQRPGDPVKGWEALTGEGYVGCGIPRSLWDSFGGIAMAGAAKLDRPRGADLPYFMNPGKSASGIDIVTANCLGCHAAWLRGKLVIGLGEVSTDFTTEGAADPVAMAGLMVSGDARTEVAKLAGRMRALERVRTRTAGANPADHIAAVLFAHRDPKTLAWSDEPLIPIADDEAIPVDVPAWWLLKKKTAMFHTGAGRGDQARIMMTASVMCVDDVATAKAIDSYFPDIRAYLMTLEPPKYPGTIDGKLAARGKQTFEARCSKCHGTYGEGGKYQSRIVSLAKVGTDPKLAEHAGQFAAPFTSWFNSSFYGELARLEPGLGYVPPPLDGVWATAPYLHNGSVPNLAAVLDSSLRLPRTAIVRGRDAYDLVTVGWPNRAPDDDTGSRWIYDAGAPGYANTGHTFGDKLTPAERSAVIEYLKTL